MLLYWNQFCEHLQVFQVYKYKKITKPPKSKPMNFHSLLHPPTQNNIADLWVTVIGDLGMKFVFHALSHQMFISRLVIMYYKLYKLPQMLISCEEFRIKSTPPQSAVSVEEEQTTWLGWKEGKEISHLISFQLL